MSMRPWKIALAVVVAACALGVATATSGTPEPVSIDDSSNPDLFTTAAENSEFPECDNLTAGDRDRCIAGALDSFNTFYTAVRIPQFFFFTCRNTKRRTN